MNDAIMQNLIQLISTQTGLQIREPDRKDFCNKIYLRMKSLKLNNLEQYYQLLLKACHNPNISSREAAGESEWTELLLLLTIGETYFFRDRGQFTLLKNQILPELIELKRKSCDATRNTKPSLRIWSAGCSSGEEPYSLAILVKELIPDLNEWDILVLGTDINSESIEKAKRGIYDAWSFRQVETQLQQQYFHQYKMRWEVNDQIRKLVKFQYGNLLQEHFPSSTSGLQNMDIIICRNVFIYFNSQVIATVLEKFYHALIPGGYLIAGHTELYGQKLGQLQPKAFPESIVYQRSHNLQVEPLVVVDASLKMLQKQQNFVQQDALVKPKLPVFNLTNTNTRSIALRQNLEPKQSLAKTHLAETKSQTVLSQAETLFHAGDYKGAIQAAKQVVQQHLGNFDAYYLLAQAWANLGEYEHATHCCQQAIKLNDLSEKPYYLLAHIAEEKGEFEQAKALFKKIVYLVPSSINAYLELSSIYEREGEMNRAKKMLKSAFKLLKDLPNDFPIESNNQTTVSELILQVKKLLQNHSLS